MSTSSFPPTGPRPSRWSSPQGPFQRGVGGQQGLNQRGAASGCRAHAPTRPSPQKRGLHTQPVSRVAAGLGVLNDHEGHGSVLMQLTGQWWGRMTKRARAGPRGEPEQPNLRAVPESGHREGRRDEGMAWPRGDCKRPVWLEHGGGGKGPEPGRDWAVSSGR